jgi:hypothetical protein
MTITTTQQTALEVPSTSTVFFVEMQFLSSTQYFCTANVSLTWGGHTWLGVGTISAISNITEADGITSQALTFTLNCADPSWLGIAAGPSNEYSGRPAKMYRCPLDANFVLIDTPERCWNGVMDQMTIGVDGETGQIGLKCETGAFSLKRASSLRMNSAQQRLKYPTDTGFGRVESLIANPTLWLSKKFQMQ